MNFASERNVFAIYVSYYVKVKLVVSMLGGEISLKLPFTLMHTCDDLENATEVFTQTTQQVSSTTTDSKIEDNIQVSPEPLIKQDKDGT